MAPQQQNPRFHRGQKRRQGSRTGPKWNRVKRKLLQWATFNASTALHLVILVAFSAITVQGRRPVPDLLVFVTIAKEEKATRPEDAGELMESEAPVVELGEPGASSMVPDKGDTKLQSTEDVDRQALTAFIEATQANPKLLAELELLAKARSESVVGLAGSALPSARSEGERALFAWRASRGSIEGASGGDGTGGANTAIARGLQWLANHQESDGSWRVEPSVEMCPPHGGCGTREKRPGPQTETAVTALAVLSFLGAGQTHRSGAYADTIGAGLDFLLRSQSKDGVFGWENRLDIHAMACLAVAEAYGLTKDPRLERPLQEAVILLKLTQWPDGGWPHHRRGELGSHLGTTGWAVWALHTVYEAGIEVPWECSFGAIRYFANREAERSVGEEEISMDSMSGGMASINLLAKQLLGWPESWHALAIDRALTVEELPVWEGLPSAGKYTRYYYYTRLSGYGSSTSGSSGTSDSGPALLYDYYFPNTWLRWHFAATAIQLSENRGRNDWLASMREILLRHQRKTGHAKGSWDAYRSGRALRGRVCSTALALLMLEVGRRFPMRRSGDEVPRQSLNRVLVDAFEKGATGQRIEALRLLSRFSPQDALVLAPRALKDPNPFVRLCAVEGTQRTDEAGTLLCLARLLESDYPAVKHKAIALLAGFGNRLSVPALTEALCGEDEALASASASALAGITGERFYSGTNGPAAAEKYRAWWNRNVRPESTIDLERDGRVEEVRPGARRFVARTDGGRPEENQLLLLFRDGVFISFATALDVLEDGRFVGEAYNWPGAAQITVGDNIAFVVR